MFKRILLATVVAVICVKPTLALPQLSTDWRTRYGQPGAETYLIRSGIAMAVFYAEDGRTCKVVIKPDIPQPQATIEDLIKEVIPPSDRGKRIRSIGLSSGANGVGSTEYERVRIAFANTSEAVNPDSQGAIVGNVASATIEWKGIQCKLHSTEP